MRVHQFITLTCGLWLCHVPCSLFPVPRSCVSCLVLPRHGRQSTILNLMMTSTSYIPQVKVSVKVFSQMTAVRCREDQRTLSCTFGFSSCLVDHICQVIKKSSSQAKKVWTPRI